MYRLFFGNVAKIVYYEIYLYRSIISHTYCCFWFQDDLSKSD